MGLVSGMPEVAVADEEYGLQKWASMDALLQHEQCDVLIDFSLPEAAAANAAAALSGGVSVVLGTTGLSDRELAHLGELATVTKAAIFAAPNLSRVSPAILKFMDAIMPLFDCAAVAEVHSIRKVDSPSATAKEWAQRLAIAGHRRNLDCEDSESTHQGATNVPIHSFRLAAGYDKHEFILTTESDSLSLRYETLSGEPFVEAALNAASVVHQYSGLTTQIDSIFS